jgi:hypothetical protein
MVSAVLLTPRNACAKAWPGAWDGGSGGLLFIGKYGIIPPVE